MIKKPSINRVPFIDHQNFHGSKIINYFGDENVNLLNSEIDLQRHSPLFICFTNRSGSNAIAEDISSIDGFKFYGEILNFDTVINNSKLHKINSFYSYLDWLFSKNKYERPIIKCSYDQLIFLYNQGYLKNYFIHSQFILLERRDLISQAVSHFIASNSKQWASFQESKIENLPELDHRTVLKIIQGYALQNSEFKAFFSMCDIGFLHLFYEDYFQERLLFLNQISKFAGSSAYIEELPKNRFQKQGTEENSLLRDDFLKIYSSLIYKEKD